MNPDEEDELEFEFEEDDEDEGEGNDKPSSKGSGKKAKMTPIPKGVKRKMAFYIGKISKLKEELKEYQDEKKSYEHELELLEDEIENLRSNKEKLEDDINKQIALANAYEKKLNRNQKDFENFKKRTDNEVQRRIKQGSKGLMMGLIDVMDNFDRAMAEAEKLTTSEAKKIVEGVGSIKKGLMKVMEGNEVEVVDPVDEKFDPTMHEAIEMQEKKDIPENTVMRVESKGYLLDGMVLRPAKVVVSKGGKPRKKKQKKKEKEKDIEEMDEVEELDEIEEVDEVLGEVEELEEE